ncbi:hypothetical protein ABZP36_019852 [Zizania latifolia]
MPGPARQQKRGELLPDDLISKRTSSLLSERLVGSLVGKHSQAPRRSASTARCASSAMEDGDGTGSHSQGAAALPPRSQPAAAVPPSRSQYVVHSTGSSSLVGSNCFMISAAAQAIAGNSIIKPMHLRSKPNSDHTWQGGKAATCQHLLHVVPNK